MHLFTFIGFLKYMKLYIDMMIWIHSAFVSSGTLSNLTCIPACCLSKVGHSLHLKQMCYRQRLKVNILGRLIVSRINTPYLITFYKNGLSQTCNFQEGRQIHILRLSPLSP